MIFHYVYILKSISKDFIYVGFTSNLKKRFQEHNQKEELSTKHYTPFDLIHYEAYRNIKDAKRREEYLKTTTLQNYFAMVHAMPTKYKDDNLDVFVEHLYEGSLAFSEREITLEKESAISAVRSKIFPSVTTFRAAWVDDQTKLELVVETDFRNKGKGKEINVWRRLPESELDNQRWIIFGRKPNASRQQSLAILNARKETTVSGQLSLTKA